MLGLFLVSLAFELIYSAVFQTPVKQVEGLGAKLRREGESLYLYDIYSDVANHSKQNSAKSRLNMSEIIGNYLAQRKAGTFQRLDLDEAWIQPVNGVDDVQYTAEISIGRPFSTGN